MAGYITLLDKKLFRLWSILTVIFRLLFVQLSFLVCVLFHIAMNSARIQNPTDRAHEGDFTTFPPEHIYAQCIQSI